MRRGRATLVSLSAAALFGGAAGFAQSQRAQVHRTQKSLAVSMAVPLASSVSSPHLPTTVLVHGLDSSKETFSGVVAELNAAGYPALALDLRGHGESPLGAEVDFTPAALADDVLRAIDSLGLRRAVLVGHSMGGRIAMRAAAIDAACADGKGDTRTPALAAVVIEDMDVRARFGADSIDDDEVRKGLVARFAQEPSGRRFADWEGARAALLPFYGDGNGKDSSRVDQWRQKRVRRLPDGSFWSDINPAAQRLARDRVLASEDGEGAWDELAARHRAGSPMARIHLWYADQPGTVCAMEGGGGIADMEARLPSCEARLFAGAGHSIHNSARAEFMAALTGVIDQVALEDCRGEV